MEREIKFEYGFKSANGIVKKVYSLSEIPNIKERCDVWDDLPIVYVRQYIGLPDKNGKDVYQDDVDKFGWIVSFEKGIFCLKLKSNSKSYLPIDKVVEDLEIIGNIHENKELL